MSANEEIPEGYIPVLNKGYVGLVDKMGSDLSVTNAARVSFDKESNEFGDKDARLLSFLQREGHTSPFRHATLSFEIYAPLMICRQWLKYVVASSHIEDGLAHNESSRRYVTEIPEFYIPDAGHWRSAPDNRKQGSGEPITAYGDQHSNDRNWMENPEFGEDFTDLLNVYVKQGVELYEKAMENGVCAEQARLFLPAYGMYVRWRWTASLGSVMHFLSQRLAHDSQKEIQDYAKAVYKLAHEHFPVCMETIKSV